MSLSVAPSPSQSADGATGRPGEVVRLTNIHKSYGQSEVLKGISLAADEGDVIALIGASGAGKSTLLRCINLLEVPDRGGVTIGGEAVRFKPAPGGGMAVADQQQVAAPARPARHGLPDLQPLGASTVLENVIEAPVHVLKEPRAEAIERADALLNKVGLYDKRDSHPAFLSGGQQQRAAIARALAIQPRVMLFDEPTSALDPELVGEVLRVVRDLAAEGRSMIVVTHEMAFARDVADRVVFLHDGLVEEEGPPAKVFDAPDSARCRQFVNARDRH